MKFNCLLLQTVTLVIYNKLVFFYKIDTKIVQ